MAKNTPKVHIPTASDVGDSLRQLTGKAISARECDKPPSYSDTAQTARYVTQSDELGALIQADIPLAAGLGAALAMIPAAAAAESAQAGALSDVLAEAFEEVANILAGLLCSEDSPHVRWNEVAASPDQLTPPDKAVLEKPCRRLDLEVAVEGFEAGHLTICTAKLSG